MFPRPTFRRSTRAARILFAPLLACLFAWGTRGALAAEPERRERVEFTTLVAHWDSYNDPAYLPFIEAARPDVAQLGFYGAHFWSLAHTPHGAGYPAHFPVVGLKECGAWFQTKNRELHERGVKVVGHMNVKFLVGDPDGPEGPRGFFKFYRDLWDEKELGPRPVADPREFLEVDREGKLRVDHGYQIGGMAEYWACLNNPAWRSVLKAFAKRGIERGVDGYVINYFYRHGCMCRHCRDGFKAHLAARFTPAELREKFGVADLATHTFEEIPGWHDPAQSSPLKRESLRWSQMANKRSFDEVFVDYGRSLKKDLILAQWDHLGDFHQINGDERCLLPAEMWGRDEDYLWYSTGGAACFTDLGERFLGEGTLQARYIRGTFDDKPFTLGKYENTRIRSAIAELAANGGAPMGFYTRFTDPAAREVIAQYYQFIRRYDEVYRGNRPYAEQLLLYPRKRLHGGEVAAVEQFKKQGRALLDEHVLFNIRPDDSVTAEERAAFHDLVHEAGQPLDKKPPLPPSRFEAPYSVRVSASLPRESAAAVAGGGRPRELSLHFVNYNRVEPMEKRSPGAGIVEEKPIAAEAFVCDVLLPPGVKAVSLVTATPETPDAAPLAVEPSPDGSRVRFTLPGFLVYRIARIQLAEK